jgi:PLP dependent protein
MSSIAVGLAEVRERIRAAASLAGRDPAEVRLIAVSKRQSPSAIREAYAAGQRDFGENYVQELLAKASELADLPELIWHVIGHLQRNKVKQVMPHAALVHTLDSVELARELERRAATQTGLAPARRFQADESRTLLLIEVNVAGEAQKNGAAPENLGEILASVHASPHLRALGLMCVPPYTAEPADARPFFDELARLRDRHGGRAQLPELSMGMSADLEQAVLAGATLVRVGTAIFGERPLES